MNLQQQVLAHMRAKFPDVTFEPGPEAGDKKFDPAISVCIMWNEEAREDIRAELERIMWLHKFCDGLESLTRATGVIIDGMEGLPMLFRVEPDSQKITHLEITDRHHYQLMPGDRIEWRPEMDS